MAIVAALLAAPVMWIHYYALLVVPLAIARPRLAGVWLLPWLLELFGKLQDPSTLRFGLVVCVAAGLVRGVFKGRVAPTAA